MYSDIKTYPNV